MCVLSIAEENNKIEIPMVGWKLNGIAVEKRNRENNTTICYREIKDIHIEKSMQF
jgi:hypothetical protein